MNPCCQVEHVRSDSDIGTPCGKPAVGRCTDCGFALCSDCQLECCGDSFCELCYDYHVTHSCLTKPAQNERDPLPSAFRPHSSSSQLINPSAKSGKLGVSFFQGKVLTPLPVLPLFVLFASAFTSSSFFLSRAGSPKWAATTCSSWLMRDRRT